MVLFEFTQKRQHGGNPKRKGDVKESTDKKKTDACTYSLQYAFIGSR